MDKINVIKDILHKHNCIYVPIYNDASLSNIYGLIINNIIFEPIHIVDYVYLAIYYGDIQKDIILMKKYCKYAIKQNDIYALYYYCLYIQTIKNNDKMKKYLTLGVERNITMLAGYLGVYYHRTELNYELMEKYYDMAKNSNNNIMDMLHKQYSYTDEDYAYTKIAIKKINDEMEATMFYYLGVYYHQTRTNYKLALLNYEKAIEKGSCYAYGMLGYYYMDVEQDLKMAKYYFLEGVKNGDIHGNVSLGTYYKNKRKYNSMKQYHLKFLESGQNSDIALWDIILHYLDVEKSQKKAKMCMIMYYSFKNNFDGIIEHYYDNMKHLLLLEHYVNFQDKVDRDIIIKLFNRNIKFNFSHKDSIKLNQLIKQFDFDVKDALCDKLFYIVW